MVLLLVGWVYQTENAQLEVYPAGNKDFVWRVFGDEIVENVKKNSGEIRLPVLDKDGDVQYLNKRYKFLEIKDDFGENKR